MIYTHPISGDCMQNMLPDVDDSVIEFTADTSRAIARVLFSGAAHRFPDIRFIFSHAGGTMPVIVERFTTRHGAKRCGAGGARAGRRAHVFEALLLRHGAGIASFRDGLDQRNSSRSREFLFGTDFPFRNAEDHVNGLKACGFAEADLPRDRVRQCAALAAALGGLEPFFRLHVHLVTSAKAGVQNDRWMPAFAGA